MPADGRLHCREFLPALLEIDETPPLPAGRALLHTILLLFFTALAWSWLGEVDVVSVARGKVQPVSGAKRVQSPEGGVIKRILVSEGEAVTEGQPLIELDTLQTLAELLRLRQQIARLRTEQELCDALLHLAQNDPPGRLRFPAEMTTDQKKEAELRLEARAAEFVSRMTAVDEELRVKGEARNTASARIAQLEATLPLVTERADAAGVLLERGVVPRMQWLELEERRVAQLAEQATQQAGRATVEAEIAAVIGRRRQLRAEFESGLRAERAELAGAIEGLEQEAAKARQRFEQGVLRAPSAGRVHLLAVHTEGGVVAPGEELLRIIPAGDALQVEAWLPNRDIGFVHEGQEAVIKLDAFPFTRYGTMHGKVLTVSADAVETEQAGPLYLVRILPKASALASEGRRFPISPGMTAAVEIRLGTRRVIDFLLTPFQRHWDESLRER